MHEWSPCFALWFPDSSDPIPLRRILRVRRSRPERPLREWIASDIVVDRVEESQLFERLRSRGVIDVRVGKAAD
jgi:CRP-like cAMP-binding protein